MKRRTFLLAALLTACSSAAPQGPVGPDSQQRRPAPRTTPDDTASVVSSTNRFAMAMYEQLRDQEGNLAFSPASIGLALNMTRAGARGETASQMSKTLQISLDDAKAHAAFGNLLHGWNQGARPYELAVANRLFGEKTMAFHRPFLDVTKTSYGAELEPVDFKGSPEAARQNINGWVEDQTRDRIQKLLPEKSIEPTTRLVLTNAIYFKGKWKTAFDEDDSRDATFHAPTGETQVPTMFLTADMPYMEADGMKMVELPYKGDDLAMTLIVPNEHDGIGALQSKLTDANLERWSKKLAEQEVMLSLPRFKIDPPKAVKLKPMLIAMGMADAFDTTKADFSGIANVSDGRLVIDEAYHKAFVEVNEEGTEAAAATAVVISKEAAVAMNKRVVADRPFIFLIRDKKSGAILFMGRVTNPTSKSK